MPQLDVNTFLPQVVWLVITFTALFLLMWRVAVPRIADLLEARQRRIEDNLDKAQESKKEAEEPLAAYEQAMNEARAGANIHIAEATARMSGAAAEREAEVALDLSARITAAATTGPAQGPRPASSMPHTGPKPRSTAACSWAKSAP